MTVVTREMIALGTAVQIYNSEEEDDRYLSRLQPRARAALELYMLAAGIDDPDRAHSAIIAKLEAFNATQAKALFWRDAQCALAHAYSERYIGYENAHPAGAELLRNSSGDAHATYYLCNRGATRYQPHGCRRGRPSPSRR